MLRKNLTKKTNGKQDGDKNADTMAS